MKTIRLVSALFLFCAAFAQGAELKISSRAPQPGEVGYRPADGSTASLNPPSFVWLHERGAASYTIEWSRSVDFAKTTRVSGLPWNTYTHNKEWVPGSYHWRYRYSNEQGETSAWSIAREVIVPESAPKFPMPTRAEQRERLPGEHPRLFLRPEDVGRIRELAKGELSARFSELRGRADRMIAAGPTPEPDKMGSARNKQDKEAVKYWWPNREQTMKACQEAETIAFVYLVTGEKKYGEAARRWILHLASWNPDGPTNFRLNCEAAKPLLYRLPRAYDWAYDALSEADREAVRRSMHRRATDAWESWEVERGTGHFNRPFGSHANRTWHKLGECAIAFYGEIPEAETWLDYAVNKFYALYPVWSDDDGGWHEGLSYWGGYMSKAVWWLQVAHSALGIDGLQKPFFDEVGDFALYVAPPGSPNMGFGDLSYRPPPGSWGGFIEYFIRAKGSRPEGDAAAYWRWWTEQWGMSGEDGILGFLYHANLPELPMAKAPGDLPQSKVFRGIGVASLHTTLLNSSEDVHLLFKSSPFGTQSHGHNPHNSFQLNAYGEPLLTTCVYRDLHGSRFHYDWAHSTRAHNAVLVNGEGQIKHTAAPHGKIVDFQLAPEVDYVMGDATEAYGKRLKRYQRHIAFVKPDLIVIYDDLAAVEPATFQFMLHGLKPFKVQEEAARLGIQMPNAGLIAQYLSAEPLSFRQWDGYDPAPDRSFPNQWHVEAGTASRRSEIGMITVLVPHKGERASEWKAERLESGTAVGVRFTREGETRVVAFRKAGVGGPVSLGGVAFEEAFLVR